MKTQIKPTGMSKMIIIAKDVVEYNDLKVGDWVEYEVKRINPINIKFTDKEIVDWNKIKTNERRSN